MNLEVRVKELEEELEKYKLRVNELEQELEKRKRKMPKGGNVHKEASICCRNGESSILFRRKLINSLEKFKSKVDTGKVDKNGKGYTDWKKAMEFARNDKYIKAYAKQAGVQITARNLDRWYKYYVTHEIQLNTSKKK